MYQSNKNSDMSFISKMQDKIDPKEVLIYLNQLGYTNIDAVHLQAFIKDLKKLMKFEERNTKKLQILHNAQTNFKESSSSTLCTCKCECANIDSGQFSRDYSTTPSSPRKPLSSTKSSSNKIRVQNEPIANPETTRGRSRKRPESAPITQSQRVTSVYRYSSQGRSPDANSVGEGTTDKEDPPTLISCTISPRSESSSPYKSNAPFCAYYSQGLTHRSDYMGNTSKSGLSGFSSDIKIRKHHFTDSCFKRTDPLQPRSGVIKCPIVWTPQLKKTDPVALYNFYQRQWKINGHKIPGENKVREQRFRWCFREKTVCGPPVFKQIGIVYKKKKRYRILD